MVYKEAIDILTSQGKFYINLGLERVQKVLELMDNPQNKLKFIHVAGTNGKGSVCAMLSAILAKGKRQKAKGNAVGQAGVNVLPDNIKVGLFTSPHVFEYTERIKINDIEIEKEIFAQGVNKIVDLADKNQIHLTEFEIITVLAFDYFAQNNVDIVILETGLGGRLDATNVIKENICSIITHIDYDHTERLGNTIEKIAYEKAGIIKENCPVIISRKNTGYEIVKDVAEEKKSKLFLADIHSCHCEGGKLTSEAIQKANNNSLPRQGFALPRNDESKYNDNFALKGTYQQENLTLVFKAIEILNQQGFDISEGKIEEGLKNVKHPCRFEYLKDKNIIIDGAHNPNGTKVLRDSLEKYFPDQKYNFIFGCLNNKNYPEMMKNLFKQNDNIYFYHFDNPNSCTVEELSNNCEFDSKSFDEFKYDKKTLTVICGSFYMIKELLSKMVTK